jgi:putative inorganic carbon (HCO3(-)) transporter
MITKTIADKSVLTVLLMAAIAVGVGVLANVIPAPVFLAIFLGLIGIFTALHFIDIFLLFALLARSSLDALREIQIVPGTLSINPASALSIVIVIVGILFVLVKKSSLRVNRIDRAFLIFLAVSTLGVLNAIYNFGASGNESVKEWVRLFSLFLLYFLIKNIVRTHNQINTFINAIFLSLVIPLAVGYYQLVTRAESTMARIGFHRIYGTAVHSNHFALYLSFFIIFVLILFLKERKAKYVLYSLVLGIPFFATLSLNGLVMIGISVTILGIVKYRKFMIAGFVILIIIVLSVSPLQQRFAKLRDTDIREEIETGNITTSFSWRIYWWGLYIKKIQEKPVQGFGLHMSEQVNPLDRPLEVVRAPHNDFLRVLIELGFIGLIAYLYFYYTIGRWIWLTYKKINDEKYKTLALGLFAIFIAFVAGSFVGNFITSTIFQYYFWSALGLLAALKTMSENDEENTTT